MKIAEGKGMLIEGTIPKGFFEWFDKKFKESKGKEKEMLSQVDIREVQ